MNPWGNIWTWYNDDTSVEIPLDNTTVVDEVHTFEEILFS